MSALDSPLYHLRAARDPEQLERMERLEAAGVCRFCDEAPSEEPQWAHWYVMRNEFPYAGASDHWLIVARPHVHSFAELPDEAGAELWSVKKLLNEQSLPRATATVERSGDMSYNGGSVAHLHVHFLGLNEIPSEPIRFRVSGFPAGSEGGLRNAN